VTNCHPNLPLIICGGNGQPIPKLGGENDLEVLEVFLKKGSFLKVVTGDERRHPMLERGHPVHASPPVQKGNKA